MKITVDRDIPFLQGVFEPYATVEYVPGEEITHNGLLETETLIIRTRTKCNAALLDGTSVKYIVTVAAGVDNIDLDFCRERGIHVQTSKNSATPLSVCNYVFSALFGCAARNSIRLEGKTIGIIGVGSTGKKIEDWARILGFKVLLCDPKRAEAEGGGGFVGIDEILCQSDIITIHVPLTDSTRKMCNASFFERMKDGAFFINTAHGDVVDEKALIAAFPKLGPVILDVWEKEPNVNRDLVNLAAIATPHISGYSYQGKLNAAMMAIRSVARFYGISELYDYYFIPKDINPERVRIDMAGMSQGQIASIFQYNYPIFTDDFIFRMNPGDFAALRRDYKYRREFTIE